VSYCVINPETIIQHTVNLYEGRERIHHTWKVNRGRTVHPRIVGVTKSTPGGMQHQMRVITESIEILHYTVSRSVVVVTKPSRRSMLRHIQQEVITKSINGSGDHQLHRYKIAITESTSLVSLSPSWLNGACHQHINKWLLHHWLKGGHSPHFDLRGGSLITKLWSSYLTVDWRGVGDI
jgi:hypothetical protein